jgi:hypothetical protein
LELHVLLSHLCADVHVKVGAGDALVHTEHVVGASLEVAGGVVGLGDETVIGRSVADGLHQVGHRLEAEVGAQHANRRTSKKKNSTNKIKMKKKS